MKKFILILMMVLLIGCQKEVEVPVEEAVIPLDLDSVHNVKLKTYNNTLPHIIRAYVEMDDASYGTYKIEMYDTNYEPVWSYLWRDLNKEDGDLMSNYVIYENFIIVNAQGAVSVHNLSTGEFLWELETNKKQGLMTASGNILYVLGYEEDYITGVSLENGEVLVRIKDDNYLKADALVMKEQELIAYKQDDRVTRNAVAFDMEGNLLKTFNYMQKETLPATWDKIESSDESESVSYLIDGNLKTSYSESVKGYGEKEWVELTRVLPTTVHKLRIANGDHSSEKAYRENAKLKQVTLSIGDGKSFTYKFSNYEYGHVDEICFVKPIIADYVLMTIIEVEPGELYKNTSFSEIETE